MGREYFTFPLQGPARPSPGSGDSPGKRPPPVHYPALSSGSSPRHTPGTGAFGLKLARFASRAGHAPDSIRSLMTVKRIFEPGVQLIQQGCSEGVAYIIEDGWTFSSNLLRSGTRQILDIQIPGDVAGFLGLALSRTAHDVTAITQVVVSEIRFDAVMKAVATDPHLSGFLLWLLALEHAVVAERLTGIGRRSSTERVAHLIMEISTRLRLAGLGNDTGFACPMTQYLLGDALGLTSVHVNRVLRDLRMAGLAHHRRGWISLLDVAALREIAGFDAAYLSCEGALLAEAV